MRCAAWVLLFSFLAGGQTQFERLQIQRPPRPQSEGPATASIEGRVVNDTINEPLRKAQVQLQGALRGQAPAAVTDSSGRFVFRSLPAGAYTVSASREGFDQSRASILGDNQASVTLAVGQEVSGVELRLPANGAISGRLIDENGDPANGCQVSALDRQPGGDRLVVRGSGASDDRGEYRISNLPPGKYMVYQRCSGNLAAPHGFMEPGDPATPVWKFVPEFFGGGQSPAGAGLVSVRSGSETRGVDFVLRVADAVFVPILLAIPDANVNPQSVGVQLLPRDPSMSQWMQYEVSVISSREGVQTRGSYLLPGSYLAVAQFQQDGKMLWYAQAPVEVGKSKPEPVVLELAAPPALTGKLSISGESRPENRPQWGVQLQSLEPGRVNSWPRAEVDSDGAFTLAGVVPGRWRLMLQGGMGHVESARLGEREISPNGFDLEAGASGPLELIASATDAQVQIAVSGATKERPVTIVVAPKGWDGSGVQPRTFSLGGQPGVQTQLPPGEYTVYAIECAQPWTLLQSPAGVRALAGRGRALEVGETGLASVSVDLIRREDLRRALNQATE